MSKQKNSLENYGIVVVTYPVSSTPTGIEKIKEEIGKALEASGIGSKANVAVIPEGCSVTLITAEQFESAIGLSDDGDDWKE